MPQAKGLPVFPVHQLAPAHEEEEQRQIQRTPELSVREQTACQEAVANERDAAEAEEQRTSGLHREQVHVERDQGDQEAADGADEPVVTGMPRPHLIAHPPARFHHFRRLVNRSQGNPP
jgi:hypothetical protein